MQLCIVLLLVLSKDEHIIHMAKNTLLFCTDLIHSALKVLKGTGNAKGQFVETVALKTHNKCGKGPGTLFQGICQKPELVSSLLNTVATANCAVSSPWSVLVGVDLTSLMPRDVHRYSEITVTSVPFKVFERYLMSIHDHHAFPVVLTAVAWQVPGIVFFETLFL